MLELIMQFERKMVRPQHNIRTITMDNLKVKQFNNTINEATNLSVKIPY